MQDTEQSSATQRPAGSTLTSEVSASEAGIAVVTDVRGAVDLLVRGRRVWSFDPVRDAEDGVVPWPRQLRLRMVGRVEWSVVEHASDRVLGEGILQVGESTEPFDLIADDGSPLTVSKGGHLAVAFTQVDQSVRLELVDTVNRALSDLRERGGAEAFLAFGCLLGAVRDGHMIGHDIDADLAVLCQRTAPVDVAIESYRLEHLMRRLGWDTRRMSAADFKVFAYTPGGRRVGIDVFSAWFDGDELYLLPFVRGPLDRDSLLPVGTVVLEGREVIAPRDPEPLMRLSYGPYWRVPDPAYHRHVPPQVGRRMSGWFRGERQDLGRWRMLYGGVQRNELPEGPSDFVRWVAPQLTPDAVLLDLGCGNGRDTVWLRGQGVDAVGLDYSANACLRALELADKLGVPTPVEEFNLLDTRAVLARGGLLSHSGRTHDVYARDLIGHTTAQGRDALWRLCGMAQRRGGRTFVEFELGASGRGLSLQRIRREAEAAGASVEHASVHTQTTAPDGESQRGRLVLTWGVHTRGSR